jgi:hypothetical protein
MATPGPVAPRWVVVVPRDQPDLYECLRRSLTHDAPFRVVLDRREGERRRASGSGGSTDRRRTDRRQRAPVGALYVAGLAVSEPALHARALPAVAPDSAVIVTACPACWTALSFEMPRFPKPPARLEAEVIHVGGGKASQHYAEIQAFTISGRPLIVQRVQALRQGS